MKLVEKSFGFPDFSFQFKLVIGMFSLLLLAGVFVLIIIQKQVVENYGELLTQQFEKEVQQFIQDRKSRIEGLIQELNAVTANPRLTASYGAGPTDHFDRFYYDLSQQIRQTTNRMRGAQQSFQPFVRFIDWEENYITPPDTSRDIPPLYSEFPEEILKRYYMPLRSLESEQTIGMPRTGYITINTGTNDTTLAELLIKPIYNNEGYFMGDLFILAPIGSISNTQKEESGLLINNQLHSSQLPLPLKERVSKLITEKQSNQNVELIVDWEGEHFAIFEKPIILDARFPPTSQITLFSMRQQENLVQDIRSTIFVVATATLIMAILISLIFSRQITRPIARLLDATHRIRSGEFDFAIEIHSHDEIGKLTVAFNEMTQGLALKERYRSVLDKVTDKRVADALTQGALELGGVDLEVSILFCDIRRFTQITSDMSPQHVIQMINDHMTALTEVIKQYNGVVDKFIGDEIMVLFGAPQSYGQDALSAVRCAHAMIQTRKKLNIDSQIPLNIGIGIATGPVLAGNMGSVDRLNYTVLGRTVNLAARLCSHAQPGEILFDQATAEKVNENVNIESLDPIALKGFKQPVPRFTLKSSS